MEPDSSSNQRPVIPASEILAKIERGEDVEYDGVIVEGELDISGLDLPTDHEDRSNTEKSLGLSEEVKLVSSPVTIANSKILGNVKFDNVHFHEPVDFDGTEFDRTVNFLGSKFDAHIIFEGAEFGGKVNFWGAEILEDAEFPRVEFDRTANFWSAKFAGEANFDGAEFNSNVNFLNITFDGPAYFSDANFGGYADFRNTRFSSYVTFEVAEFGGYANFQRVRLSANFRGAKFRGIADFSETEFGWADFNNADFGDYAIFEVAEFGEYANFQRVKFSSVNFRVAKFTCKDVDFSETEFEWADLDRAEFDGIANFGRAKFGGRANFEGVKFAGEANFEGAKFDEKLKLDNFKFEILYITWESIKDRLSYSGPVYLALIKNFKVIERFNDADDCYYAYRKESQTQKKWYSEKSRLIDFLIRGYNWISTTIKRISKYFSWINKYPPFTWIHRFNWSKLLDWIGFVSCGYGVRIQPIILWVLGSVLGFAFLYKHLPQGIAESGPSTVTMEAVNNSTLLFTFSSGDGAVSPSWGECLYFSFTALTGGTPDGLHPVGLCKYAVMVEGVLGYLFLALFVVVLARKIIR